ncbi:hypothetical protein EV368DRAFT_62609 [Lentinula lateritia]|uniref:Uncharacterized protein n=1 Tax=Lentinula aff. lateritia TaxID=2804960 RepID=A0ACC1UD42_9AGAR|nr:hypothetical protein F5876DRAFT_72636 [Lentinula aff. lateritia]KAJ3855219.1 hypothetical protein EV368DRAFT_62609 [Lentinula lateritia]
MPFDSFDSSSSEGWMELESLRNFDSYYSPQIQQPMVYYPNSALFEETTDFVKYPYKHYDIDETGLFFSSPVSSSGSTLSPSSSSEYSVPESCSSTNSPQGSSPATLTCSPTDIMPSTFYINDSYHQSPLAHNPLELNTCDTFYNDHSLRSSTSDIDTAEGRVGTSSWPVRPPASFAEFSIPRAAIDKEELNLLVPLALPMSPPQVSLCATTTQKKPTKARRRNKKAHSQGIATRLVSPSPADSYLAGSSVSSISHNYHPLHSKSSIDIVQPQASTSAVVSDVPFTRKRKRDFQEKDFSYNNVASHHRAAKEQISYKEDVDCNDDDDPEYNNSCHVEDSEDDDYGGSLARTKRSRASTSNSSGSTPRFLCPEPGCRRSFKRLADQRRHGESAHEHKRFPCIYCPAVLSRYDALIRHQVNTSRCRRRMLQAQGIPSNASFEDDDG